MESLERAYQAGLQLDQNISNIFQKPVVFIKNSDNKELRNQINDVFDSLGKISSLEYDHFVSLFSKDSQLIYKQKIKSNCFNADFLMLYNISSMNISNTLLSNMEQLFSFFKFENPIIIFNFFMDSIVFDSSESVVIDKKRFKKLLDHLIKHFYIGKIDNCFSKAIIGLLRLDSRNLLVLYDLGNIYRRISDSINFSFSQFSSIGPFLTKIGASLHASLSVFVNIFLLGLMDHKRFTINRITKKESFRSYEISSISTNHSVFLDFYRKDSSNGVNKGCIIVFQSPNPTKWYMKTFHLAFVSISKNVDQYIAKKYQQVTISSMRVFETPNMENSISNFRTNLLTGTALELINTTFFDLREPLLYVLLDYLGLGPQTVFFMNLCVFGGFYILTKELQNFQTVISEFGAVNIVEGLDAISNEILSKSEKLAIVETAILIEILMLEDMNGNNFGFVNEDNTRSLLSIIDFAPPNKDFIAIFPSDIEENQIKIAKFNQIYFDEAPLSHSKIIKRENCKSLIREGFLRLRSRMNRLRKPTIRLFSYPSSSEPMAFSQFTEEYYNSGEAIGFSEFLKSVSEQICYHIFQCKSTIDGELRKNSEMLGFIDGFMDTERNLSNPKRYTICAKEILINYIDIVSLRYQKYETMLINDTL